MSTFSLFRKKRDLHKVSIIRRYMRITFQVMTATMQNLCADRPSQITPRPLPHVLTADADTQQAHVIWVVLIRVHEELDSDIPLACRASDARHAFQRRIMYMRRECAFLCAAFVFEGIVFYL